MDVDLRDEGIRLYQRLHVSDGNKNNIKDEIANTQFYGLFLKNKNSDLVLSEHLKLYNTRPKDQKDKYDLYVKKNGLLYWRCGNDKSIIFIDVKRCLNT